jgi:RNA polymerase sigma-70 factor, ECF subfamily
LKKSSQETFLERINDSRKIIYKVVNLYVDDEEERKDLIQEVILQSYSSFGRFNGDSKFSTWLYRVSLNTVLSYKRKEKRRKDAEKVFDPFVADESNDLKDNLYKAIKKLEPFNRIIVSLHLDEYSNPEIAEITGLTENHVAVKLHRCKQQITRLLQNTV